MKEHPEEHDALENENTILDKRQLSYKVSANSMYGAMGVKRGYLPFMTGAMCTTARGRQSIEKAANFIQSTYKGKLIYGDTDSTYVTFPHITDPQELWDFCKKVEEEIMSLFPRPMKLAFEEKIYWRYFILTKKRYMALSCDTKGKVSDKIFKRGVLLARRDNSKWIREAYQDIIMKVFYRMPYAELERLVIDNVYQLFTRVVDAKQFIITKSVGNIEDYKIKALPDDPVKRAKRLKELGCSTEDEYIAKALPSQAQLAEKMRRRGKPVAAGSRIEYVIIDNGVIEDKLFNKIEDADYFLDHTSVLSIDPMYYLKLACNPLDQVIEVAYGKKDFCLSLYKYLKQKHKVVQQLKGLYAPNLSFD
jgi:DNA polymerase elongation subunit (family B)